MTIMAEDMELTESLISRLKTMEIDRITVQGNPVDMGGAGAGTKYAERVERLDVLFRRYTEDKWMQRVKKRMAKYFQMKAAAQEAKRKSMEALEAEARAADVAENGEAELENGGEE